jgi:hypothetical protein
VKRFLPLFFTLLFPFSLFADGGVYRHKTALAANVTIPDQRALLCWSNGVEQLAIDTHFMADGTNFAWVVPLPSEPKITEATTGLFNTLDYIFRPPIVHEVFPFYSILLFCTGVAYLLLSVRRNSEPRTSDTLISFLTALSILPISACFAIPLILLLPYTVWRVRVGKEGWLSILLVLLLLFILSGMLLPSLGKAKSSAASKDEYKVSILNSQTVGAYDTTTLASKDPHALIEWLNQNDFVIPAGVESAVSNYVQRKWVFVATRLHRDTSGKAAAAPQPLCFTFPTKKPVYPMQLTGIGNTNLDVELFVFGPSKAEAADFNVQRSAALSFNNDSGYFPSLRIVHPLLSKLTVGSKVATHLVAKLTPDQMKRDVELKWAPFTEFHRTLYSDQGATLFGLNWGAGVFCFCLLIGGIVVAFNREQSSAIRMVTGFATVAGISTALLIFMNLPKTEVRMVRLPRYMWRVKLQNIESELWEKSGNVTLAEARASATKIAGTNENIFSSNPIREEDSPGNYVLAEGTNGFDFIMFDSDGGAHTNM